MDRVTLAKNRCMSKTGAALSAHVSKAYRPLLTGVCKTASTSKHTITGSKNSATIEVADDTSQATLEAVFLALKCLC